MISSIELLAGASLLQMMNAQQAYEVRKNKTETISIALSAPALQAEGLHLQTWGSSFLLANQLHRFPADLTDSGPFSLLELGSGTGLVGISAAVVWGVNALLTDFPSIVAGTAANIKLNHSTLEAHGGSAICGSLDWKHPGKVEIYQPSHGEEAIVPTEKTRPRIILTADTLYTQEQPAILAHTILTWLQRDSRARVMVCYPLRVAALEAIRKFWEHMEHGGLEAIDESQERIEDDQWDDEKLHEWSVWRWKTMPQN
jgi:predicted nicotinamide N-methyase